jgi:hypothetical protein
VIRSLLRDALRRHRPIYLWVGGFLALLWLVMVSGALAPTGALSFSLGFAWFLGVFAGVSLFASREIGLLPIPRRTLWRAQWIASTLVATFWTTAAKLVGALIGTPFNQTLDLEFIALSSCLDFLYTGVLLAVAAATGVAAGRVSENSSIVRKAIQALGMFVALMGGFAWGFVLRPIVPTSWTQVTGATAMVMGAALAVSVAAFFYSPRAGEPRPSRMRRDVRRRQDVARMQRPGRLVGLPRLIVDDLTGTARLAALIPAIVGAAFFGVYAFNPAPGAGTGPLKAMKEMGWLPLREDTLFAQCYFLLAFGLSLVNSWRSGGVDPSPLLRQLRVLPLGVRRLNALIVGRRLLGWLVLWLFLLLPHVVVFRSAPSTLRLDILAWIAGADALVYALHLCWMKWLPTFAFAMGFGLVSAKVIDHQSAGIAPYAGIAIGLACLAAAVWINHTTLTWRQELYRGLAPPPFAKPFGLR